MIIETKNLRLIPCDKEILIAAIEGNGKLENLLNINYQTIGLSLELDHCNILMDIQMPGLNGYEATRQIRKFNKNVVIVAQTAFGLSGDREKAIAAGCNDYISKPIDKEELFTIIEKQFNRNENVKELPHY